MDERSSLAKQYEVMFNECVKFSESTVLDVTRDPRGFEKVASTYRSKVNADSFNSYGHEKVFESSMVDGFIVCENKVPFIDVFSSVI